MAGHSSSGDENVQSDPFKFHGSAHRTACRMPIGIGKARASAGSRGRKEQRDWLDRADSAGEEVDRSRWVEDGVGQDDRPGGAIRGVMDSGSERREAEEAGKISPLIEPVGDRQAAGDGRQRHMPRTARPRAGKPAIGARWLGVARIRQGRRIRVQEPTQDLRVEPGELGQLLNPRVGVMATTGLDRMVCAQQGLDQERETRPDSQPHQPCRNRKTHDDRIAANEVDTPENPAEGRTGDGIVTRDTLISGGGRFQARAQKKSRKPGNSFVSMGFARPGLRSRRGQEIAAETADRIGIAAHVIRARSPLRIPPRWAWGSNPSWVCRPPCPYLSPYPCPACSSDRVV